MSDCKGPMASFVGLAAQQRFCLALYARLQLYSSSRASIQLCIALAATVAPALALMAAACLIAKICTRHILSEISGEDLSISGKGWKLRIENWILQAAIRPMRGATTLPDCYASWLRHMYRREPTEWLHTLATAATAASAAAASRMELS